MRFLVDAVLPATLLADAPAGIEYIRWEGADDEDEQLVRAAAKRGYRGVIFFDRNSLAQPGLVCLAEELGVALVAVDADDPIEAKERILLHTAQLRRKLADSNFVLILASEVRRFDPPTVGDPAPTDPELN